MYHDEGVSCPQAGPLRGALWFFGRLAVKSDRSGQGFTYHTAADVLFNGRPSKGDVGTRCRRRQPIRFVVSTRIRASAFVTGGEGHGGEDANARACLTYRKTRTRLRSEKNRS